MYQPVAALQATTETVSRVLSVLNVRPKPQRLVHAVVRLIQYHVNVQSGRMAALVAGNVRLVTAMQR